MHKVAAYPTTPPSPPTIIQLDECGETGGQPFPSGGRDDRLGPVISIVVPAYNEERSVALLLDELRSTLDGIGEAWEVVFVDDGSTDGTFSALTRLHNGADNVRVVRLRRNFGKAAALTAGFAQARGDDRGHNRR